MKFIRRIFLFLAVLLFLTPLKAKDYHFFKTESFGKPFVSDILSSHIKIETGFINDLGDHYFKPNYTQRPLIEAHMGTDIPLLSYYKNFNNGRLKTTTLISSSFNLLIDGFEPTTAMVVNTDYWVGYEFRSVLYHPSIEKIGLKNIGLIIMPLFHESTHIGDEYAMEALVISDDFYRVNVSYEAWKLSLLINDPDTLKDNVLSARIGMQGVWFPQDGYYQYTSLETQGQDLLPSERCFSYWMQINWRRTQGLAASKLFHQINSVELHNRVKYGYFADDPEGRRWNINAYFGWEYQSDSERKIGAYLRAYYGINPNGQFRYIDNFYFVGLALTLS